MARRNLKPKQYVMPHVKPSHISLHGLYFFMHRPSRLRQTCNVNSTYYENASVKQFVFLQGMLITILAPVSPNPIQHVIHLGRIVFNLKVKVRSGVRKRLVHDVTVIRLYIDVAPAKNILEQTQQIIRL